MGLATFRGSVIMIINFDSQYQSRSQGTKDYINVEREREKRQSVRSVDTIATKQEGPVPFPSLPNKEPS